MTDTAERERKTIAECLPNASALTLQVLALSEVTNHLHELEDAIDDALPHLIDARNEVVEQRSLEESGDLTGHEPPVDLTAALRIIDTMAAKFTEALLDYREARTILEGSK